MYSSSYLFSFSEFEQLQERAVEIKETLLPAKKKTVRREHIVEDLTDIYSTDKDMIYHNLDLQVAGEPAMDIDGVKREVFCLFFKQLLIKFFVGDKELVPQLDPKILFTGFFETVGRIISHAFVLTGFFPVGICKAAIHMMLTGKASTEKIMSSFVNHLCERERYVVRKVMDGKDLSDMDALCFLGVLSFHGCKTSPKTEDRQRTVENVAATSLLCKPLFCYGRVFAGMNCYPLLWIRMSDTVIDEMYNKMKPKADDIVRLINYEYTELKEDETLRQFIDIRSAEERIQQFLERYVESRSDDQLADLLQFWTGSNISIVPCLFVAFNSLQWLARRPLVSACIGQITLSRYYISYEEFEAEMTTCLKSEEAGKFDSI